MVSAGIEMTWFLVEISSLRFMVYNFGIYGPLTSEALAVYKKLGVDAVFADTKMGIEAKEAIKHARDEEFKVYACIWTFEAPVDDKRLGVENVYGERGLWTGAGCPNNPKIREHNFTLIEKALDVDIDGIILDGVRFPSFGSGLPLFLTCFCEHCIRKASTLGYDLAAVRKDLKNINLHSPQVFVRSAVDFFKRGSSFQELKNWLRFRCDCITAYVKNVMDVVRRVNPKVEVGVALFAPSLAPLVGQNYVDLCKILDFVQPMIYHRGDGIACVNYEIARLAEDCFDDEPDRLGMIKSISQILGYSLRFVPKTVKELIEYGFSPAIIESEVFRAKELTKTGTAKLTPILFVIGSGEMELNGIVKHALLQELDGIVYFAYSETLKI